MLVFMAAVLGLSLFEYRKLYKVKQYREIAVSAMLLAAGLALGLIQVLRLPVPSPLGAIVYVFKPISNMLSSMLS